jgi:hypothetical protein
VSRRIVAGGDSFSGFLGKLTNPAPVGPCSAQNITTVHMDDPIAAECTTQATHQNGGWLRDHLPSKHPLGRLGRPEFRGREQAP